MASGHFQRLRTEFDFFGHFPSLFARLAPVTEPNASQMRAQKINAAAKDGSLSTLRTIGRAALASDNRLNGPAVERVAALLTGDSKTSWPSSKMHTTAVDCYTGDRIIVSQASALRNNIPLAHGAAASSSLPGVIGPTLLGQRFCMDGGMCSNPSHVDVVAGSKRALIVTLNDGLEPPFLTGIPHPLAENIRQIEAVGTKTLWIKANPPDVNLLDPKQIGPALRTGYERAQTEASRIKAFWA
jgi:NTE family protein